MWLDDTESLEFREGRDAFDWGANLDLCPIPIHGVDPEFGFWIKLEIRMAIIDGCYGKREDISYLPFQRFSHR